MHIALNVRSTQNARARVTSDCHRFLYLCAQVISCSVTTNEGSQLKSQIQALKVRRQQCVLQKWCGLPIMCVCMKGRLLTISFSLASQSFSCAFVCYVFLDMRKKENATTRIKLSSGCS